VIVEWNGQPAWLEPDRCGPGQGSVRLLDGVERFVELPPGLPASPATERASLLRRVEACPVCGGAGGAGAFQVVQLFWPVEVTACATCGHLYKREAASAALLARIYGQAYVHFDVPPPSAAELRGLRSRVQRLGPRRGAGRHLDYACGAGALVAAALAAGWDSVGADPFLPDLPPSSPLAGRLHRLDESTVGALAPFDVISIWAGVEHLPSPAATLGRLAQHLAPGGRLVFNSPNGASLVARRRGARWASALLVEHLSFFTPRSVRWLAASSGLAVESLRSAGTPFPLGQAAPSLESQGLRLEALPAPVVRLPVAAGGEADPAPRAPGGLQALARLARAPRVKDGLRPVLSLLGLGDHLDATLVRRAP